MRRSIRTRALPAGMGMSKVLGGIFKPAALTVGWAIMRRSRTLDGGALAPAPLPSASPAGSRRLRSRRLPARSRGPVRSRRWLRRARRPLPVHGKDGQDFVRCSFQARASVSNQDCAADAVVEIGGEQAVAHGAEAAAEGGCITDLHACASSFECWRRRREIASEVWVARGREETPPCRTRPQRRWRSGRGCR